MHKIFFLKINIQYIEQHQYYQKFKVIIYHSPPYPIALEIKKPQRSLNLRQ